MDSPWVMMILGLVAHLSVKAMRAKDTTKRNEEGWNAARFSKDYLLPFIFSAIASFVFTAISIDKGWPIWASFFMSYASSSALYNIYPVITNPQLWTGIAGYFTSRITQTPPKDTPPDNEQP